eukprot:GHVL01016673.1.p1 GENE.GHVL01016673.1~~GHVL01016673.1.p1  ORF type:complete len:157 (-),score=18.92 GHVL01016673.1:46-516(-)
MFCSANSVEEINYYFTSWGTLLRYPPVEANTLDCTSGSCTLTNNYAGFATNDAAVIVDKSDCSGVQSGNVKSGPVQISGSTFDFATVTSFSLASGGKICWCYNCFTSPTTDFSQYKTQIADVNGPTAFSSVIASSAIIYRLSTSFLMILLALSVLK